MGGGQDTAVTSAAADAGEICGVSEQAFHVEVVRGW